MSGKPKRAPASPEEEREQLRQLTRQLHEAAKDARAAARELRDARDEVVRAAEDKIGEIVIPLVNTAVTEINVHFAEGAGLIAEQVGRATLVIDGYADHAKECAELISKSSMDTQARILGFQSRDEVLELVTDSIHDVVAELASEKKFIDDVADALRQNMEFKVSPG